MILIKIIVLLMIAILVTAMYSKLVELSPRDKAIEDKEQMLFCEKTLKNLKNKKNNV